MPVFLGTLFSCEQTPAEKELEESKSTEVSEAGDVDTSSDTSTKKSASSTEPVDSNSFDPLEMVFVPEGAFYRGCNEGARKGFDPRNTCEDDLDFYIISDVPLREIWLSDYWIDKFEVTLGEYATCVAEGGCKTGVIGSALGDDELKLPVSNISWENAQSFCKWEGKRLPTEAEWEKAGRGPNEAREYPWGNKVVSGCEQANLLYRPEYGCPENESAAQSVDSFPGDVSYYGVRGMLGNVCEWVSDWAGKEYYKESPERDPQGPSEPDKTLSKPMKILKGGYYGTTPEYTWLSLRRWGAPDKPLRRAGFRCASSEPTNTDKDE